MNESGCDEWVLVDLERSLDDLHAVFSGDSKWELTSRHNGRTLTSRNLKTVWWRRSALLGAVKSQSVGEELDREECYWAVRWLLESLPAQAYPFGHPTRLRAAENKLL